MVGCIGWVTRVEDDFLVGGEFSRNGLPEGLEVVC